MITKFDSDAGASSHIFQKKEQAETQFKLVREGKMKTFAKSVSFLLAGTAAFAISTPALAQDSAPPPPPPQGSTSTGLDEIVVTAQRRAENLQDVPLSITALPAEQLSARGITSTADLTSVVPGLTITTVAGQAAPRIRGVGSATALGGNENAVAIYVDGVYIASTASSIFALNNIAQISVLKGPQGTLFGRNATGGVIQVTTRDPSDNFGGSAGVTYGNRDRYGGSLYVTGPLATGLSADLAVMLDDQNEGYGRNLTTGNDVNKSKGYSGRSKIKADIGGQTTAVVGLDYSKLKTFGPSRRPVYGSIPVGGLPFTGGKFDVESDVNPFVNNRQGGVSLNLTHRLQGVDLISITAYRKSVTTVTFDIDATRLPLAFSIQDFRDRQFSQELQLVSRASGPFKWTLGAYYFKASGGYFGARLKTPAGLQLFDTRQRTESGAIYGQGSYELTPSTQLTLGLRYTKETREFTGLGTVTPPGSTTPQPRPGGQGELSVGRPTWRIALDQQLGDDVLVYASYNRGFKSGGFNAGVFTAPANSFNPESIDAYEVGLKSDLLGRSLRVNAAGFYYDYKDIQLNVIESGIQTIFNAAAAKIYGLDFDVTAIPVTGLTLNAGLAVLHSELGTFTNALIFTPLPAGGNALGRGVVTGNELPQTPDWTLTLAADYSIPLADGTLTFSANYFHSDGWYADVSNRLKQPNYDILNGSILFELGAEKRYSVRLWGRNLTNAVYSSQLNSSNFGDIITQAPGRSYGVTAGMRF